MPALGGVRAANASRAVLLDLAWLQLTYAIAFFLLLAARSWNVISLDHVVFGRRTTPVE